MEIVYGPVSSWRLRRSLGVDLICQDDRKICTFDCIYCSLGKTDEKTVERRNFVEVDEIEEAVREALDEVGPDVITFSGTGEPTLAKNLGEAIDRVRDLTSLPLAVLTNSSLMDRKEVREELAKADIVVGSLDASNEGLFEDINEPHEDISFENIVGGMKKFGEESDGLFSLEIMFVPENESSADELAEVARSIGPDEVQINTPLRSSPVEPLGPEELERIQGSFEGLDSVSVYDAEKLEVRRVVGEKKMEELKRPEEGD